MPDDTPPQIVNFEDAPVLERRAGPHWGAAYQVLTSSYLAIGSDDPHEVCAYPDIGKIMMRSASAVGQLQDDAP